jgi:hypothetical protein
MKFLGSFLIFFCGNFVHAKETKFPFIVKQRSVKVLNAEEIEFLNSTRDPKTGKITMVTENEKMVEISGNQISTIIHELKTEMCSVIEDGEFKVWLKGEASGKLFGIGASSESGIEVTVKCAKDPAIPKKKS